MKKTISFLLVFLLLIGTLTGCHKDSVETSESTESTESTETDTSSDTQTSEKSQDTSEDSQTESDSLTPEEKYKDNEAYQVGMEFIEDLQEGDILAVTGCIALYNNSVIKDEDLQEIIKTSKWKELINQKGDIRFISFDQRYEDNKMLSVNINNKQWNIPITLDYDGVWRVSLSEYIVENFQFVVPWETIVYWDGVPLDRNRHRVTINTGSTLLDLYTVTCTPTETEFKFESDAYGEFLRHITPRYLEEPYELDRHFNDEQSAALLQGVQDMWNDMFNDYFKHMTIEEWTYKHFGYKTTDEEELAVWNQIKDNVEKNNYTSIKMIDISKWDDNYIGISTNRGATVNFSYKIQMERTKSDGSTETITTDILHSHLKVEKAQGGYYIILELTDPDLFKGIDAPKEDDIVLDDYSEVGSSEASSLAGEQGSEIPSPEESTESTESTETTESSENSNN